MAARALIDLVRMARALIEQRRARKERRENPLYVVMPEVAFVIDDDWGLPDGYEWAEPAEYEPGPLDITRFGDTEVRLLHPDGTITYEPMEEDYEF